MIIDSHVRIGESFNKKSVSIDEYVKEMKKNNIDKALLCPQKPISYKVEDGNDYVEKALDKYKGMFFGAVRIDPWKDEDSIKELDKRLSNHGFKAVYLNPWEETFRCNDDMMYPFYDYIQQRNIPIIIETGYPWVSHISQIGEVAKLFPRIRIMATNAGQLDLSGLTFGNASYILGQYKNIYLGTAAAVGAEWLNSMASNIAPKRVIFETGYPLFEPYTEKYRIDKGYMSSEVKEDIYYQNVIDFILGPSN